MSLFMLDDLRDDAAKISAWIEISARKAARDRDYARKHGIVPQQAMSMFRDGRDRSSMSNGCVTLWRFKDMVPRRQKFIAPQWRCARLVDQLTLSDLR